MRFPGRHAARWLGALLVASTAMASAPLRVEETGSIESWIRRCGQSQDLELGVVHVLFGAVVLNAAIKNGTAVRVEISREPERAFKRVGAFGISAVGEYPNWFTTPPDVQEAFSRLVACVQNDPSLVIPEGEVVTTVGQGSGPAQPRPPWRLLAGASLGLVVLVIRLRGRPTARILPSALALVALAGGTLLLRPWIVEPAFLHQNGQGPLWVSYALGRASAYGPGYQEVFGWFLRLIGGDPNHVVFVLQSLLGAAGPGLVWVLARASGAGQFLAWVLALLVAVDPSFARLSQSESYFAACAHLFLVAGVVLAVGTNQRGVRDRMLPLAVVSAGLLMSQAARIHPVSWAAAALVPLVVVTGRGALGGRIVAFMAAAVGVGLVVAATAGSTMFQIMGAEVGRQWTPALSFGDMFDRVTGTLSWAGPVAVVLALLSREWLRGAVYASALLTALAVLRGAFIMGQEEPIVVDGYIRLFSAPLVAAVAACAGGMVRRRWHEIGLAIVALGAGLAGAYARAPEVTTLPTDAMELALVMEWSEPLSEASVVEYVGEADKRTLFLPLYGDFGIKSPTARRLKRQEPVADLYESGGATFYYRSSLCSSADGRGFCDRVESGLVLTPQATATLPARPSRHYFPYDRDEVDVGLYRVEGRR